MDKNDCEEDVTEYPKLLLYPAVKPERKMKQKAMLKINNRVQSLSNVTVEKLIEFLVGNAINLEGQDEQEMEAEIARESKARKASKDRLDNSRASNATRSAKKGASSSGKGGAAEAKEKKRSKKK